MIKAYTMQEAFYKAAAHLLKQNRKALLLGSSTMCAYRAPDGCRCAIGCLIPDELYSPGFESKRAHVLVRDSAEMQTLFANIDSNFFLNELQAIHDNNDPIEWRGRLRVLAHHYRLGASVLEVQ